MSAERLLDKSPDAEREAMPEGLAPSRRWRVISTSLKGTSHHKLNKPCQDNNEWYISQDGILIVAVADGAGSAELSQEGSAIAARAVISALRAPVNAAKLPEDDAKWREFLLSVLNVAKRSVAAGAASRKISPRDLATTLILVIAMPDLVAAAQVGDGAAVLRNSEGDLIPLTTPQNGEYINEVTFLTADKALDTAQVTVWRGRATHLAAFSDGLQMLALKMPDGTPHAPFFSPLFNFVSDISELEEAREELELFLQSPRILDKTDDDLTLVLAALAD